MSSPDHLTADPERSVAEFFAEIESADGAESTAGDHRDLVAAVRSDRGGRQSIATWAIEACSMPSTARVRS